jgi:hypothetical protein
MRRFLVSSFLAEVTQQIHSFRASGVIAAQSAFATASDSMALRKSAGSLWIVLLMIALVVMRQLRASCRSTFPVKRHCYIRLHRELQSQIADTKPTATSAYNAKPK